MATIRQAPGGTLSSQRLARGDGSAADRELGLADAAFERGELDLTEQHLERARKLAPSDPAPELGLLRVALDRAGAGSDFGAAENDASIEALLARCTPKSLESQAELSEKPPAEPVSNEMRDHVLKSMFGEQHPDLTGGGK